MGLIGVRVIVKGLGLGLRLGVRLYVLIMSNNNV